MCPGEYDKIYISDRILSLREGAQIQSLLMLKFVLFCSLLMHNMSLFSLGRRHQWTMQKSL